MKHSPHEKGFTILLAALVASLVLSLGISVFTIAQKQIILTSTSRNSQYAFYAADSGAECALYWDVRHNFASTSAPFSSVMCDAASSTVSVTDEMPYPFQVEFEYEPNGYCVHVTLIKNDVHPRTLIRADGFSVGCDVIDTSGRALQRSVELTY